MQLHQLNPNRSLNWNLLTKMYIHLTLFIKILTVDSLSEDQVITEEETIELLESNRHALIGNSGHSAYFNADWRVSR